MNLIPNINDEFDYAECFDPGEGKLAVGDYGQQRVGLLYSPDIEKWAARDCPLCFEPFSVIRRKGGWYCTHCRRKIA